MKTDSWEKAKEIFGEALKLPPDLRPGFLDKVCKGDADTRREVESLLASLETADSFLETPAVSEFAKVAKTETKRLENGRRFAHYEILKMIGAGGMGEVYLARDQKLDRKVAIKILNQKFSREESNLQRFIREAKLASALNHPNILIVHEVGEAEEMHYIVSEFIKGKTLREILKESPMKLPEVLDIAIQIANALVAAHEAHLVHRDIKPENVMIRPDGYVKVLDFGLAKHVKRKNQSILGFDESTVIQNETAKGIILGTINYMSPEQAKGERIDKRTDIFSLGAVIYEMIAGRTPFAADSVSETFANLINTQPPPLSGFEAHVPDELERSVSKMLRKNKDERYQQMKDLLVDLKALQKRLDLAAELEGTPATIKQNEIKTQIIKTEIVGVDSTISPNNLTDDLLLIIGREKEIAEIKNLLLQPEVRLLTMTGVGGTGKTTLAKAVARELLSEFSDGAFFVELAAITNSELVAPTIAQPLGVKEVGGKPIVEILKSYLREKQILLILDNFEQVVRAAPQIAELLSVPGKLKILITSRVRLHLTAEREFIVSPLSIPANAGSFSLNELSKYEAIKLFVERAQNAKPNFDLNEENAQAVIEICTRLDGLPLAIELAATRVKMLSPQAIVPRLGNRLKLLTGGARDLPARQQTMRGAVEWSYDLLEEGEKALFRRLAVFEGRFSVDAAETVCGWQLAESSHEQLIDKSIEETDFDGLDLLTSLLDKNLLVAKEQFDGETRLRILEVIREFALEQLETSGEGETLHNNHAEYFLGLAEKAEPHLQTAQAREWLNRLEEEHDNLRAAFRWLFENDIEKAARLAAAMRIYLINHSHLTEGREWLKAVLEQGDGLPGAVRFKLLNGLGYLALDQGDNETARKMFEKDLAEGRTAGDRKRIAESLRGLGAARHFQGDYTAARKFHEEGLALHRELNDKFGIAASLNGLASSALFEGDNTTARPLFEESLTIFRELGNESGICYCLLNLGTVAYNGGDYEAAREYYCEVLRIAQNLGYKDRISFCLDGFAELAAARKEWKKAAQFAGAAEQLRETIGFESDIQYCEFRYKYLKKVRAVLGETVFAAAYEQGRKLKLDEAIKHCQDEDKRGAEVFSETDSPPDLMLSQNSDSEPSFVKNASEPQTTILSPITTTLQELGVSPSGSSLNKQPISSESKIEPTQSGARTINPGYILAFLVFLLSVGGLGFWIYSNRTSNPKQIESVAIDAPKPTPKLYWQMTETEQLGFIRERARYVQTMIGDEPTEVDEEALREIKVKIDDYVEGKDSLSQKPFEEGLRVIYGRATQYAPLIIRAYETRQVPPALGLYQAMVESEYHDCWVSQIGSVGLFQFKRSTAQEYGLTSKDYCDVEKQSDAAAHYMMNLKSDFGEGKSSWTLALFSFNQGEGRVRDYLRELRGRGIKERSFWAVLRDQQNLKEPLTEEGKEYVPRFFAAAIIGETPEAFEISTPPLSTLATKTRIE